MAIPAEQLAEAALLFGAFTSRVPEHLRDKLRTEYRIEGNSIILFSTRTRYDKPEEWFESPIAKFTYVQKSSQWKLFWMGGNLKWRGYENLPKAESLSELCKEVHEDPWCCFWG